MTPQELRNSILQLAIQGKLVEQRLEEGTGEDLYQQIQKEKEKLINEGRIKKGKTLPDISKDEMPFGIPETWKWVHLDEVCLKIVDGDHNPPKGINKPSKYWMLSAKNINNNRLVNLDQVRYLSKDVFEQENKRTDLKAGEILFTIVGTLGRSCVYTGGHNICFQRSVSVLNTLLYNYYLKYALDSAYIQSFMVANSTGTAQKGFYLNQVEKLLIPVPPYAEQKRIVERLEELMPLVNQYEEAWNRLEELNKCFSTDLQKSILQYAIQGKLVPQHPEEGTGDELFKEIQKEKQNLIKKGLIKKSKTLPAITDDEMVFPIPENWVWVHLNDLCTLISDGTHKTPKYVDDGIPFLSVKDISGGIMDFSNTKYITQEEHNRLVERCKPKKGDVLVCRIGTLGKALCIDVDTEFSIFVSLGLIQLVNSDVSAYIERVINSGYGFSWIQKVKVGGGTHTFKINLNDLRLMPIPLPPLAEQQRIVARIERLMPLCEELK